MKKVLVLGLFIALMSPGVVWGEDAKLKKLRRGLTNIATSPIEIPREIRAHWIKGSEKTYHISAWLFCGLVKGLVMTPVRLGSGVYDVLTFPVDYPRGHQPLLKPDYVLEDWPKRQEGVIYKNIGDK